MAFVHIGFSFSFFLFLAYITGQEEGSILHVWVGLMMWQRIMTCLDAGEENFGVYNYCQHMNI